MSSARKIHFLRQLVKQDTYYLNGKIIMVEIQQWKNDLNDGMEFAIVTEEKEKAKTIKMKKTKHYMLHMQKERALLQQMY